MYPAAAAWWRWRTGGPEPYIERITIRKTQCALAATLMLLCAAAGHGQGATAKNGTERDRETDGETDGEGVRKDFRGLLTDSKGTRRPGGGAPRLSAAPAQSLSGSLGTRIELFARAGLALLNVTARDSLAIPAAMPGDVFSSSATRFVSDFGWGGGARLMSGHWGIEGTYSILENRSLSPGWLNADDAGTSEVMTGLFDQPLVASRADMLVGQVVRVFPLSGGRTEFFVGLGVGWMRATDSSTDRLLSGVSLPALDQVEVEGELPPGLPDDFLETLVPELEVTADRTSVVYAGSVGLSLRVGRVLLRPRVEVIISRALTTEATLSFPGFADLDIPDAEELGAAQAVFTTSATPRIFLLSVDIGLGN